MKKYFVLVVAFIFLLPVYALAGEYVLVKGKGIEVCEAYRNNLNSFNLHNVFSMACERRINPKITDFEKPEWEELELQENIELLKKIELFLGNYVVTSNNVKGWEEYIESLIKYKRISAKLSQIDIDNDGKKENVIKYRHGNCPERNLYGTPILLLNGDKNDIDIEKTKPLLQNPRYLKNGPLSEGWDGAMYDVFIYKGKICFDRWRWSDQLDKEPSKFLKVFVTEPDKAGYSKTKEICRLQFRVKK